MIGKYLLISLAIGRRHSPSVVPQHASVPRSAYSPRRTAAAQSGGVTRLPGDGIVNNPVNLIGRCKRREKINRAVIQDGQMEAQVLGWREHEHGSDIFHGFQPPERLTEVLLIDRDGKNDRVG